MAQEDTEINGFLAYSKKYGLKGAYEWLCERQMNWKTIPMNVAVIGVTKTGKSSFINAIRGLTADDRGAARVNVVQETMVPTPYEHPKNPRLVFYDLPGCGTKEFPQESYLEAVTIDRYDFFILMTCTTFTETDSWLANEIEKRKKPCFFVRTKISDDLSGDKKAHPKTHNETDVINRIRKNIFNNLSGFETLKHPIFLIDNYEPHKYDFGLLQQKIINDVPNKIRESIILSLTAFNIVTVKEKAEALRSRLWRAAAKLTVRDPECNPWPLSTDSLECAIREEANFYFEQFGLDEDSIERLANITGFDKQKLLEVVKESGVDRYCSYDCFGERVPCSENKYNEGFLTKCMGFFNLVGVIFGPTKNNTYRRNYEILEQIIDEMAKTAFRVVALASGIPESDDKDE